MHEDRRVWIQTKEPSFLHIKAPITRYGLSWGTFCPILKEKKKKKSPFGSFSGRMSLLKNLELKMNLTESFDHSSLHIHRISIHCCMHTYCTTFVLLCDYLHVMRCFMWYYRVDTILKWWQVFLKLNFCCFFRLFSCFFNCFIYLFFVLFCYRR